MATRKQPGTAIVDWEKEMEAQAKIAADAQRASSGGGQFFSTKAGQLTWDGNALPGNQMAVIIMADLMVNAYYEGAYDPDNPASPVCFAMANDEDELEPHEAVDKDDYFTRQNDVCAGCPQNEFGSALVGRGKACKNQMRLALIPAGAYKLKGGRNAGMDLELFDDPEHFAKATIGYLNLPVMSVRNYSAFVKQLAADLRRPPWGVIANVMIEPDAKSQFKIVFELIDVLPNALLSITMPRHAKESEAIAFPYTPPMERDEPKANNAKLKRPAAKPAAARGRR